MPSGFFLFLSLLLITIAVILLIRNLKLYKGAIRTLGTIIKVEEYPYLCYAYQGPIVTEIFYIPVIEVIGEGGKSVKISYNSMNSNKFYRVGDKIEVIYPKGKIDSLKVYNKFIYLEESLSFIVLGIVFMILAFVLPII